MVPENIVWAFFSPSHYAKMADDALLEGTFAPKDIYYKDTKGKWVKVTAVFGCIDVARKTYRYNDAKYLGAVQTDTKAEVERGGLWPKPETLSQQVAKKKRLASKPGVPGTISVKKKFNYDPFADYLRPDRHYNTYWDNDNY